MSFNANKATAAFELPPPKPEPIGIFLSKNISTPYISYKLSKNYQIPSVLSLRGSIQFNKLKKIIAWKIYQKRIFQASNAIHVTNEKNIINLKTQNIDVNFVIFFMCLLRCYQTICENGTCSCRKQNRFFQNSKIGFFEKIAF